MSTREKLIKARLSMLALAEQLKNVSPACQRAGISRTPQPTTQAVGKLP